MKEEIADRKRISAWTEKIIYHGEACVTGRRQDVLKRPSVILSGQLIKAICSTRLPFPL